MTIMTKLTAVTTVGTRYRNRNKQKDDATSNNTNGKEESKPPMKETMHTMGITHRMLTTCQDISSIDQDTLKRCDMITCLQCTSFQVDGLMMSFLSMQSPILLLAMSCVRCKKIYVTSTLICVW